MPDTTKITLSDKELSFVTNAEWILTKHAIIEKVYNLFAANIPVIEAIFSDHLPAAVKQSVPKIYKGENYLQLPYVMLDHPRYFKGNDIFALRTMFWWGNFFSITLHVSGEYQPLLKQALLKPGALNGEGFFIGVQEDQWQHHFEETNYIPLRQCTAAMQEQLLHQRAFIKIALKYNLQDWNKMPDLLAEGYRQMAALLY